MEEKLTGKPLCLLLRKIETISATLTTRGKETTFKRWEQKQSMSSKKYAVQKGLENEEESRKSLKE